MYAKAQPSADWDQIVEEFKEGKRNKDERVYDQFYLSEEEYLYIVNKYLEAYRINSDWRDNVEFVENYLKDGGVKDKWIPRETDDDGFTHPGYRSYEDVPNLVDQFSKYLDNHSIKDKSIARDLANIVFDTINECKNFYKFDGEESSFKMTCAMGASPTSNAEMVKKYWKEKTGENIEIEERNPKLFWYHDKGYTDEDLAEEFDDPNWKENLQKEWNDELEKRKQRLQERLKKIDKSDNV